ncbi:hypothetical protein ADK55_19165 [Streptomyces sp. WM4235]|uniref:hypothetical protein n=1 Tax=Streptomyces sp. WM4235 TaxID=1415551 RepID=UPI0006AE5643|nr:hypothetical protein [Streptomyces sp. WM4235]KOU48989.1 hypothetical protein ADK55_19165 [Streptomyces sp. WM4235]
MTTYSKWGGTRAALARAEDRQAAETIPAAGPAPVAPAAVPELGTPEHIEALADAETAQAARDLEAIEERVINGDESVTPEQVEQVRGLARFAHLRREAAARKAEAQREREAEERRVATLAEAQRLMDAAPKSAVYEKLAAAQQAVKELREAIHAYNHGARAAFDTLAGTPEVAPAPFDPSIPNPIGFGYGYPMGQPALWLDGVNVLTLDENGIVKRSLHQA